MSQTVGRTRRHATESSTAWAPLLGAIRLDIALIGMLAAFCVLAYWAGTRHVLPGDLRVTQWVQGPNWQIIDWMAVVPNWSMVGAPLTIGGLFVAVALSFRNRIDAAVILATLVVRPLNTVLKHIVESPRPSPELVDVSGDSSGLGFPSGHVSGSLLVVGALAWALTRHQPSRSIRRLIWAMAVIWMVGTGLARVRIGVHWPTDVIGGWLWSLPVLIVITRIALALERAPSRTVDDLAVP